MQKQLTMLYLGSFTMSATDNDRFYQVRLTIMTQKEK